MFSRLLGKNANWLKNHKFSRTKLSCFISYKNVNSSQNCPFIYCFGKQLCNDNMLSLKSKCFTLGFILRFLGTFSIKRLVKNCHQTFKLQHLTGCSALSTEIQQIFSYNTQRSQRHLVVIQIITNQVTRNAILFPGLYM